jgi:crossover junction endodeoxyribonuclease RuvC
MSVFLGIDPGALGAVALIRRDGSVTFWDTPVVHIKSGKKTRTEMNAVAASMLLSDIRDGNKDSVFVTIEKVGAMPGQGVTSMFSFGKNFGTWLGILAALKLPHQQVAPVSWKKRMMTDMGKDKDASRVRAMQLFPNAQRDLYLKKHHGRADALLIAEYGRRQLGEPQWEPAAEVAGARTLFQ